MVHRPARPLVASVLAALVAAGCAAAPDPGAPPAADPTAAFPMTLDDCGRPVVLDARPRAVLTVGTPAVRLLHAAGATEHIVARAGEFGAPTPAPADRAVAGVPVIAEGDPSAEVVVGSGADLVVGYGLFEADPAQLEASGISSVVNSGECGHDGVGPARPRSFDAVYADIATYGRVFGTSPVADAAVAGLRTRVEAVRREAPGGGRSAAAVYFFAASSELSAYGGGSMAQAQFDALGLRNVFDVDEEFLAPGVERLIGADPDVLVIGYGFSGETGEQARARLLELPGVVGLRAVRSGQVIEVPVTQSGADPGAVDGLETMAAALRP